MPSRHAAPRYSYVNADPESHLDEAHRGGTLSEMSARGGTHLPSDSGTQPTEKLHERKDNLKADPGMMLNHPHSDNITDMPSDTTDSGVTGEVVTGTGNPLPNEVEEKWLGGSHGGKHVGQTRHTFRSAHAQSMGGSGPGYQGTGAYGKGKNAKFGDKFDFAGER
ncbi:hypothetical protein BZA77DRAFT_289542 [Pyronema omphalodes]|nr:hypothetical protein BZA77DRAFT_289542 [Pyronema omphalodes]